MPHRLVPRRPAALPAQVHPLPDWTLLVHGTIRIHIYPSPSDFQGTGGHQSRQTVEVKGRHVLLTCAETDCFDLDWYITQWLTPGYKTRRVLKGFISRAMKRRLEKW